MMKRAILVCVVLWLVVISSVSGDAQTATPGVEQLGAIVIVLSGIGPFDNVSINYNSEVPKAEALKDVETLASENRWLVRKTRVTVAQPSTPGAKRTTSVLFETPPLANTKDGTLPVEPFVVALKRFRVIELRYLINGPGFQFRGLKDFENKDVKISLRQSGNSYGYSIRLKKSDFDRLGLPTTQPVPQSPRTAETSTGARIMLILGIALAAAVLAYLVAAFVMRNREDHN